MEFGFDLGEDFAVFLGLFPGEFAVLAADGEVVLVFGLGGFSNCPSDIRRTGLPECSFLLPLFQARNRNDAKRIQGKVKFEFLGLIHYMFSSPMKYLIPVVWLSRWSLLMRMRVTSG